MFINHKTMKKDEKQLLKLNITEETKSHNYDYLYRSAKEAMQEQSIAFAEWCAKNYCPSVEQGVVTWTKEYYQNKDKIYTTSELYEIFNKEN